MQIAPKPDRKKGPGSIIRQLKLQLIGHLPNRPTPLRPSPWPRLAPLAHGLGVPVVATPVGGLSEQLRDGVDGVLAHAVPAEALAAAMAALCDPARRAELAQGARAAGQRLNDWDAMAGELLDALRLPRP